MDKEPNNKNRLSLQSVRESLRTLSLSTLLLIVTTAVALVAVGSFAWVSRNRNLDSRDLQMNMDDELFELSVSKNPQVVDENWDVMKFTVLDDDGQSVVLDANNKETVQNSEGRTINGVITSEMLETLAPDYATSESVVQTGDGVSSIVCAFQIDGTGRTLRPGATGTLTFFVKTKKSNIDLIAHISLAALGKSISGGSLSYERVDDAFFTEHSSDKRKDAFGFLKGHILFFTDANKTTHISPDSDILINGTSSVGDYQVTIYWEWPVTYERLSGLLTNAGVVADEELSNHLSYYFLDNTNSVPTAFDAETDPDTKKDILSIAYNVADTEIGKDISHIFVEIKASLKDSTTPSVSVQAQPVGNETT